MILNNKRWMAFFSHTGNEINNISKKIGRYPDRVVTNNKPGSNINTELVNRLTKDIVYTSNRPTVEDYSRIILEDCVITLHGWMRIVPKEICTENEMYNLHPGLITRYPELKGADPQKRVAESITKEYNFIGCVIHKVTPGVDEGEVLAEISTRNHYSGEDDVTRKLHSMATDLWVEFL